MSDHPQVDVSLAGEPVPVDEGIAPLVAALWQAGVRTVYSCQGNPGPVDPVEAPENLAYVAFASPADRMRFADRVPADRPDWLWVTEHEVAGGTDSVHFPPADLSLLVERFGLGEGGPGGGAARRGRATT